MLPGSLRREAGHLLGEVGSLLSLASPEEAGDEEAWDTGASLQPPSRNQGRSSCPAYYVYRALACLWPEVPSPEVPSREGNSLNFLVMIGVWGWG